MIKDFIIGFSLLWLLPSSIIIIRIIFHNLKLGTLKDFNEKLDNFDNFSHHYIDLKNRIDIAIKYINDNYTNYDGTIWHEDLQHIYTILRGVDK